MAEYKGKIEVANIDEFKKLAEEGKAKGLPLDIKDKNGKFLRFNPEVFGDFKFKFKFTKDENE